MCLAWVEVQERKNTEVLLGHLDYRDGRWCADDELVEKLQERLVKEECWPDFKTAEKHVKSEVLVIYP